MKIEKILIGIGMLIYFILGIKLDVVGVFIESSLNSSNSSIGGIFFFASAISFFILFALFVNFICFMWEGLENE